MPHPPPAAATANTQAVLSLHFVLLRKVILLAPSIESVRRQQTAYPERNDVTFGPGRVCHHDIRAPTN